MMDEVILKRRLELIRILEEVVPVREDFEFDMAYFADAVECKTAGCALGSFAYLSPLAKEDGWEFDADLGYVGWGGSSDFDAAEEYFGMNMREATHLFGPERATPQEVAQRARELWKL